MIRTVLTPVLVSHTHWDREWYRTFQAFRARLVDTVDRVLDLVAADPGYRFLLDGQAVILEDYLEVRPGRRDELSRAVRDGRIAVGPWYVQPDSLMPSGEAHIRNLLEGRRVASDIGPVSEIAYTPDSFGHPAQFPQILRGFGLRAFVYWRGNPRDLGPEYLWVSPDGTGILACHLPMGYFNAAALPRELKAAVDKLEPMISSGVSLLMNGSDHLLPDPHTREVAEAAGVSRGLLEDYVAGIDQGSLSRFSGELVGARVANLLPGVWSTRTYLKLRNRRCEALLEGWAEPWAALGMALGLADERPSLRSAWRSLLHNQAHDSICGCSQDAVHEQMLGRYDECEELARETTVRVLERIAGLGAERRTPRSYDQTLAVFNPSPHPRTDVVRFRLDAHPPFEWMGDEPVHPLVKAGLRPIGFAVDGVPARLVRAPAGPRPRVMPDQDDWEVEFVAPGLPAFGYRTFGLTRCDPVQVVADDGRQISGVSVNDDGSLRVSFGDVQFDGLCALEDGGDRGDTYDHDPFDREVTWSVASVRRSRFSGIETLEVTRSGGDVDVVVEARVAPGVPRVDLHVVVDNRAPDHRLRVLFPSGAPAEEFYAATTFDVARRSTAPVNATGWVHPAPSTFPCQGWVWVNGLQVGAPGLYEASVSSDGVVVFTLLRSVGWLSRHDLKTRPGPAGPATPTPGAQCLGRTEFAVSVWSRPDGPDPRAARDAELGLWAVTAGDSPVVAPGESLLSVEPRELVLSALKPAVAGAGIVLRVLNPTDETREVSVEAELAGSLRLDETPSERGDSSGSVPGHSLRSWLIADKLST